MRTTLAMFRRVESLEEQMIRGCMPRTASADPLPVLKFTAPRETVRISAGLRLTKSLTFTIAEVVHV